MVAVTVTAIIIVIKAMGSVSLSYSATAYCIKHQQISTASGGSNPHASNSHCCRQLPPRHLNRSLPIVRELSGAQYYAVNSCWRWVYFCRPFFSTRHPEVILYKLDDLGFITIAIKHLALKDTRGSAYNQLLHHEL